MTKNQDYGHLAYQFLQVGFIVLPIVAGLDKFFHLLTDWSQYLSPFISKMVHYHDSQFMIFVGIVEIAVGIGMIIVPRICAFIAAGWLGLIVINLVLLGHFWDIALRDIGLGLSAIALGMLSQKYNK